MDEVPSRGRIYRGCGCRDAQRKQLGTRCPKLKADPAHGSWGYAVDLPCPDKKRGTRRRTGFADSNAAEQALVRVLQAERTGVFEEPDMSVRDYLLEWLAMQEKVLRPTTFSNYHENVHNDLLPIFGTMRLADLRARHINAWVRTRLEAHRGPMIVYRVAATLRTALNAAVRTRQLAYNPALHAVIPRPPSPERLCWSPEQAAAFLRYNTLAYADQLTDLFEVMISTGLRRGEILALHWSDVHLMDRALYVRWTLAAVNNNHLHLGPPKNEASRNWVGLNSHALAALHRQAAVHQALQPQGTPLAGLVFASVEGGPLRPQWVLDQLRKRTAEVGLPTIGLHDLRHTAATIMITAGVPIATVSKTLRHANLSTTVDLYGHLLKYAAHGAVDALARLLDQAEHDNHRTAPVRPITR